MTCRRTMWLALVATAIAACTPKPSAPEHVVAATPAPPADDPRVICPPGATQKKVQQFGGEEVWCVDADGYRHGPDAFWNLTSRQLVSEYHYVRGQLDGTRRAWYDNGRRQLEATCRDGLQDGPERFWHPNGRLEHEVWHDKGRRVKVWRWWNEKGRLVKKEDHGGGSKEPLDPCIPESDE